MKGRAFFMDHQYIPIGTEGAVLQTYFLDVSEELKQSAQRPVIVICPGGAYAYCSDREAEPIAMAFCRSRCGPIE